MESQSQALTQLFLTEEELAPLTAAEINQLYLTFCQPAPIYTDTELETFCMLSAFLPDESAFNTSLNVVHLPLLNLLLYALRQPTDQLLKTLPLHVFFSDINLYYYAYISFHHYNCSDLSPIAADRLYTCLLNFAATDATVLPILLTWALNGERTSEIYKTADSYNYFAPSLAFVKKLVPAYYTASAALQCYHTFKAFTWAWASDSISENIYPYPKDTAIAAYLTGLLN